MEGLLRAWTEIAVIAIEALSVGLMCVFIAIETARGLMRRIRRDPDAYRLYRLQIGKTLLVGLELLVAADVIETVALEPTLPNLLRFGVLVVLRTVLSWSVSVEIEGRWPWRGRNAAMAEGRPAP